MKYKSGKEIARLNTLEHETRTDVLNQKYQVALRNVAEKHKDYINFNQDSMIHYDTNSIITCYNNNIIQMNEFINRMELLIGFNIAFTDLKNRQENGTI